jgi:PHD/YefM family antitoxin component YafN of YafNO toxin-antitoxin module
LIAPAALVPAGLHFIPDEKLLEASREMRPWIPAIKVAITELRKYQDFTLVEVDDAHDHVRITKRGGEIVIDVNSDEEVVHVSVPLQTMLSAVERVERARGEDVKGGAL